MTTHYQTELNSELPAALEDSSAPWRNPVFSTSHVQVFRDGFPVSPGHLLFVPAHNTTAALDQALHDAVAYGRHRVEIGEWAGFNLGMNWGAAAGQTVPWPHVHLIPRYEGDVVDPVGGVRNLLQNGLGNYQKRAKLLANGGN